MKKPISLSVFGLIFWFSSCDKSDDPVIENGSSSLEWIKTADSPSFSYATFIAKLGGGGTCGWIQETNENIYKNQSDYKNFGIYAIAGDSKGYCYVSGYYVDSIRIGGYQIFTNNMSGFIVQLDQLGRARWITPGNISFPFFTQLTIDKDDNLICGGAISKNTTMNISSPVYNSDASLLFAKLSPSNQWLWAKELVQTDQAIPEMNSTCTDITTDKANNLYITGNSNGKTTIGSCVFNTSAKMEEMIYVAKFSPDGIFSWAKTNDLSDAAASSASVTVDLNSNCYIGGFHNRAFSMEPEKILEGRGVFVAKIKQQ